MEIWTALAIGFFGSFHCIGMCGPIALALPGSGQSPIPLVTGRVLYNFGRVVTYSILGALFGLVGHTVALAGFQQALSIILGLGIIASVLLNSSNFSTVKDTFRIDAFYQKLKSLIATQFSKRGLGSLFVIGLLNGLLPCGFVYVGLAGSLTTGSVLEGSLFMALFGLGTLPAMMAMSLAPGFISLKTRQRINTAIPYLTVTFGLYLIFRGIAFGIGSH